MKYLEIHLWIFWMADGSSSREDFTFTSYRRNRALSQSQRFCILRSFVRLLACSLVATLRYGRYLLPPISHIFSSRHFHFISSLFLGIFFLPNFRRKVHPYLQCTYSFVNCTDKEVPDGRYWAMGNGNCNFFKLHNMHRSTRRTACTMHTKIQIQRSFIFCF